MGDFYVSRLVFHNNFYSNSNQMIDNTMCIMQWFLKPGYLSKLLGMLYIIHTLILSLLFCSPVFNSSGISGNIGESNESVEYLHGWRKDHEQSHTTLVIMIIPISEVSTAYKREQASNAAADNNSR